MTETRLDLYRTVFARLCDLGGDDEELFLAVHEHDTNMHRIATTYPRATELRDGLAALARLVSTDTDDTDCLDDYAVILDTVVDRLDADIAAHLADVS